MNRLNGQPLSGQESQLRQTKQQVKPVRAVFQREASRCRHCGRKMHWLRCTKCSGFPNRDERCSQCRGFGQTLECQCAEVEMHLLLDTGVEVVKAP
jgi:excinuclease UvrABC ATPase subunit